MLPFEDYRETVLRAVRAFESLSIPYHFTGGIAAWVYGDARLTQDVDVVAQNERLAACAEAFVEAARDAGFLLQAESVRPAVERHGLFQLLDRALLLKVDVYARELIPGELSRSVRAELFAGCSLPVVCRSDAALSKLVWISKGSHKSRRDLRLYLRSATPAEQALVERGAAERGLESLLRTVLAEREELLE